MKWLDTIIGAALMFLIKAPLTALMVAATASQLWQWFLIESYGAPPAYKVLYGVAAVFQILTFKVNDLKLAAANDKGKMTLVASTFTNLFIIGFVMVFCLVSAWCVKYVLNW